jgi:hypothetical protein
MSRRCGYGQSDFFLGTDRCAPFRALFKGHCQVVLKAPITRSTSPPNTHLLFAMAIFLRFAIAVLAAAVFAHSHAVQLAEPVTPQLSPRVAFYGGYGLSAVSCPAGTSSCGDTSLHGCCPTGQNCFTFAFAIYCCPDSKSEVREIAWIFLTRCSSDLSIPSTGPPCLC